ncbi:hypothetical protein [Streptomyces termitum]|uniref:hypothetical protein n=1 Tax=Streptomyces termitum TaxID=67368 RepID=UPI0037BC1E74
MTSHDELRLLPWSGPDGKPCFLSTDDGDSRLSRLADTLETAHLASAAELLDEAARLLGHPHPSPRDLRPLALALTTALHQVLRVAESRGHRLPPPPDTPT